MESAESELGELLDPGHKASEAGEKEDEDTRSEVGEAELK